MAVPARSPFVCPASHTWCGFPADIRMNVCRLEPGRSGAKRRPEQTRGSSARWAGTGRRRERRIADKGA
eukprot:15531089-Heterocapsa_arctica.AAC.1